MKRAIGLVLTLLMVALFVSLAIKCFRQIRQHQAQAPVLRKAGSIVPVLQISSGKGTRTIPVLATLKSRATISIMSLCRKRQDASSG